MSCKESKLLGIIAKSMTVGGVCSRLPEGTVHNQTTLFVFNRMITFELLLPQTFAQFSSLSLNVQRMLMRSDPLSWNKGFLHWMIFFSREMYLVVVPTPHTPLPSKFPDGIK